MRGMAALGVAGAGRGWAGSGRHVQCTRPLDTQCTPASPRHHSTPTLSRAHACCLPRWLQGKDAIPFLESLVVGDVAGLADGTASLSVFTNEKGGIIDDTGGAAGSQQDWQRQLGGFCGAAWGWWGGREGRGGIIDDTGVLTWQPDSGIGASGSSPVYGGVSTNEKGAASIDNTGR